MHLPELLEGTEKQSPQYQGKTSQLQRQFIPGGMPVHQLTRQDGTQHACHRKVQRPMLADSLKETFSRRTESASDADQTQQDKQVEIEAWPNTLDGKEAKQGKKC
ncbi:hypothetical protein RY831_04830 [Noviherbaspirillum sp. CPCC 100848]|uniref:Uncharacterized protein n=1 Tax=Noviherbaspirillum album TaxID=3080276 RepID=A0ABU6J4B9_9BURK|nr:hypothetical protein [Noviherbaspirillum sp. CPCC 100848]MEC4718459.1 hypothetical protein [Noviherbaspirillum sp. CPCC 100848]